MISSDCFRIRSDFASYSILAGLSFPTLPSGSRTGSDLAPGRSLALGGGEFVLRKIKARFHSLHSEKNCILYVYIKTLPVFWLSPLLSW